jgi:hypothetical protein
MATIGTFAAFSSRGYSTSGSSAILPTGGNYVIDNSVLGKRVHVFTSPGTFTIPTNASLNSKFTDVEILLVGGGGDAGGWDDAIGGAGGGGGGAVVYDSAFRMPKGFSLSVTVGARGDYNGGSRVPGLPTAMGGGNGGGNYEYSKGGPGGTGGGGSWQNGAPNGPAYSVANPGWTYGNTGPSAPTNTRYFMPVVLNQPSETASNVANSLAKTWSTQFLSEGNGQYGGISATPDSARGLPGTGTVWQIGPPGANVNGLTFSSKAFRMRGGGGASYAGGIGGQGVLTDFINKENGSYEWILSGGHGEGMSYSGNSYQTMLTYSNVNGLIDSGVFNGTWYPATISNRSPYTTNWYTDYDNIGSGVGSTPPSASGGWGSGGGQYAEIDGERGVVILRYDLNTFPGGAPSASANVFGGSIETSANGRFRYHIWRGWDYNSLKGTSANSQGYVAFDNDEEFRLRNEGAVYYSEFRGNGTTAANTSPFYFNRELPPFTVQYMIIGGGGSSGTKGTSVDRRTWLVGGGGSGGMQIGAFTTSQQAPQSWYFPSLGTNLANSASGFTSSTGVAASQDYGYMRTGSFSHRPGYVEVRANSMLNNRLPTDRYVDSAASPSGTVGSLSRQNSTTIKIRGTENSYAQLVQRDRADYIYEGYLGNNGVAENPDQQYLIWNYNNVGNPTGRTPAGTELYDMIQLSDYDHYFYSNYVRARAGRRGRLHVTESDINSSYTDGTSDTGPQTRTVNRNFTLGHKPGGPSTFIDSASPGGVTGTHPRTGELYYNAIRFDQALCTWSKASDDLANDRWTPFYNQLNSYNVSRYDNDVYSTPTPTNPDAVTRINRSFTQCGDFTPPGGTLGYYDRRIHFSNANSAGTVISNRFNQSNFFNGVNRQARIQYVEECCNPSHPSFGKRRFQYLDWWGGDDNYLTIEGSWKVVSVTDAQIFTYTSVSDENHRTLVEVYKRSLRSLWVKHYFAYDINAGEGGKGNRQGGLRRRSGGTSSIHAQDSNTPLVSAGGGGAGGWEYYESSSESYPYTPYSAPGEGAVQSQYLTSDALSLYGVGIGTGTTNQGTLSPAGAGGGPAWSMRRIDLAADNAGASWSPTPGSSGSTNGAGSPTISQVAGGGSGGGAINSRDWDMGAGASTFLVGGATRGGGASGFGEGRQARRSLFNADDQHGGRGFFGSTYNWSYYFDGAVNLSSGLTYFHLNVNQFPHNAAFASGGGGGAAGNGGDGSATSGGTGGNGASGATYSLTGYPTIYGAGGGGFGRRVNGAPGSGMPADPSTVSPVGDTGPAYTPYGIGGGWTAGREEGGGPDGGATKYYPGSGPWPSAYDVPYGTAHMDAMRYSYGTVPTAQKGDIGSRYNGRQGVVIIAYNAAPYYSA